MKASISVDNKVNVDRITQQFRRDLKHAVEVAMSDQKSDMIRDTNKGKDIDGKSMSSYAPYSPAYKKYKKREGRTGNVDLQLTGNMLTSMTASVKQTQTRTMGRIEFIGEENEEKASGNIRKRKFFGLTNKTRKRLAQRISQLISE